MAKRTRTTKKKSGGQILTAAQVRKTMAKINKASKTRKTKSRKALDQLMAKIKNAEKKFDRIFDEIYDALAEVKTSFHKTRHKVLEAETVKGDTSGRP